MKPYILDDDSATEYKRLDLMSKILDPWTRRRHNRRCIGPAGRPELLDAVLDDDGRVVTKVSIRLAHPQILLEAQDPDEGRSHRLGTGCQGDTDCRTALQTVEVSPWR